MAVRPFNFSVNNIDSVISHYSKLRPQNPNDSAAYSALGWAYMLKNGAKHRGPEVQKQLIDSAISAFEINLKINPNRSDAYVYLGSVYCLAEEVRPAFGFATWSRYQIKKGRRLIGEGIIKDPRNALAYFHMGMSFLVPHDEARLLEATRWFEHAIEIEPHSPEPYMEAGKCYVRLGQYTKAHQAFSQALNLIRRPLSQSDIDVVAKFYQEDFRPSHLLLSYMAQVSYLPAAVRWPFGAGLLLFQKGAKDASWKIMRISREAFAKSVYPARMAEQKEPINASQLAYKYLYEHQIDKFVETLKDLDSYQACGAMRVFYSVVPFDLLKKKEIDQAMHLLSRLNASDQRKNSCIFYYQSKILADEGRSAEALTLLKRAAESDPRNVEALRDLAIIYEREGNYRLAIDAYQKTKESEGNLETWASAKVAVLRKKSGDLTGALHIFDRVLQDDPELRDEEFTRANNFSSRGETELAAEAYELAAGLGSVSAQDSLKKLNIKW